MIYFSHHWPERFPRSVPFLVTVYFILIKTARIIHVRYCILMSFVIITDGYIQPDLILMLHSDLYFSERSFVKYRSM